MRFLGVALIWGLMASVAQAEPAQCSVTDFGTFDCNLARDGAGLTFLLPNGQVFAFALTGDGEGSGYLGPSPQAPEAAPIELGRMTPAIGAPGCWVGGKNGFAFCVQVFE